VQFRLLDPAVPRGEYEQRVWAMLAESTTTSGLVPDEKVRKAITGSGQRSAQDTLRADLLARGWYDPQANARRVPMIIAGGVALLLAVVGFIAALVGEELSGLIWAGFLFGAGIGAFVYAASLPETTQAGEDAAAPWRGYLAGLQSMRESDVGTVILDDAMPYVVAMGASGALKRHLERASDQGYAPAWLGRPGGTWGQDGGFYPYWVAFHASAAPSSGSGGAGSSGASAGGGGAGGSF
jgi:hypothetical protein